MSQSWNIFFIRFEVPQWADNHCQCKVPLAFLLLHVNWISLLNTHSSYQWTLKVNGSSSHRNHSISNSMHQFSLHFVIVERHLLPHSDFKTPLGPGVEVQCYHCARRGRRRHGQPKQASDINIIHVGHVAQQGIIDTPQRNQQQISCALQYLKSTWKSNYNTIVRIKRTSELLSS